MAVLSCFVLLLFPRAEERAGKEEVKLKAPQTGMHTHAAAWLSEKARSNIDHFLESGSENKFGGVSPLLACDLWWYVTPWLGVSLQESWTHLHHGFDRDRSDQRLV